MGEPFSEKAAAELAKQACRARGFSTDSGYWYWVGPGAPHISFLADEGHRVLCRAVVGLYTASVVEVQAGGGD